MLLGVGMSRKEWELVNEMDNNDTTNADKKIRFPRNNKKSKQNTTSQQSLSKILFCYNSFIKKR